MKKIPTIFNRNPENMREILPEHHKNCGWVFDGEGVATRKYDGTCCRVLDGQLWKRREVKRGRPIPDGFAVENQDEVTGKTVGWMPVEETKEDRWHREAMGYAHYDDGTYELCGPKVQGNPDGFKTNILVRHSEAMQYLVVERTFEGIRSFLEKKDIEGLVFHHPDGRMAKIKKRDYGQARKIG